MVDSIDDLELLADSYPGIHALPSFLELAAHVPWFRMVGEPVSGSLRADAEDYASALGFPEAEPALVGDWEAASDALMSMDVNAPAWEAEEQLRAAVSIELVDMVGEDLAAMLMHHVSDQLTPVIEQSVMDASNELGIQDEDFLRAAMGAGIQAAHQAAMVALVGADETHAFAARFKLFEVGRWPIGIFGTSFLIY